ncbi:uncharacterized protein LOC6577361 [Drosophila mojavensis]|nr:uncharacterized protein LOC6577361 [Drosophila mojavensis]
MSKKHGTLDIDAANVTAYDAMRLQNCKSYTFRQGEMYPSIRPPLSLCRPAFSEKWIANVAENTGCKPFDPKLYSNKKAAPVENVVTQKRVDMPRPSNKYVCSQIKLQKRNLDYSKLTPYDLMRMLNCKPADYRDDEIYPSIRPPVSQCCPALTAEYLMDTLREGGCERHFDMEKDDVVEVWRRSPNKESLGYYGVGTGIHKPEAVLFNQAIAESLKKVNPPEPPKPKEPEKPPPDKVVEPPGYAVLNRPKLAVKVRKMPTVQEAVSAVGALRWVYCPRDREQAFPPTEPHFPIEKALDMEKLPGKSKQDLKQKDKYCELQCHIPENTCTQLEWMKYKEDQKSYEEKFKKEMEELEEEMRMEVAWEIEKKKQQQMGQGGFGPSSFAPPGFIPDGAASRDVGPGTLGSTPYIPPGVDAGGILPRKGKLPSMTLGRPSARKSRFKQPKDYDELYNVLVPLFEHDDKQEHTDAYEKCIDVLKDGGSKISFVSEDSSSDDNKKRRSTKRRKSSVKKTKTVKERPLRPMKKSIESVISLPETEPDKGGGSFMTPRQTLTTGMHKSSSESESDTTKKTRKKRKKGKGKGGGKGKGKDGSGGIECPCEICSFLKRRSEETESPLIQQMLQDMKRENKIRELRDYYKQMCHCEYMKYRKPEYPAPQHKCDAIQCDNTFCANPKLAEYCDCLDAMENLKKLLGPKHCIVNNELLFNINDIQERISRRLCECL